MLMYLKKEASVKTPADTKLFNHIVCYYYVNIIKKGQLSPVNYNK